MPYDIQGKSKIIIMKSLKYHKSRKENLKLHRETTQKKRSMASM